MSLKDFQALEKSISTDKDIAIVVNCAGLIYKGAIIETKCEEAGNLMKVNMMHPVLMTTAFLPRLLSRKEKSGIINVSSILGQTLVPGMTYYCASKRFLSFFTEGLQTEMHLDGKQVHFLDYRPGMVATNMSKGKPGFFCILPEDAALRSLDDLGNT